MFEIPTKDKHEQNAHIGTSYLSFPLQHTHHCPKLSLNASRTISSVPAAVARCRAARGADVAPAPRPHRDHTTPPLPARLTTLGLRRSPHRQHALRVPLSTPVSSVISL